MAPWKPTTQRKTCTKMCSHRWFSEIQFVQIQSKNKIKSKGRLTDSANDKILQLHSAAVNQLLNKSFWVLENRPRRPMRTDKAQPLLIKKLDLIWCQQKKNRRNFFRSLPHSKSLAKKKKISVWAVTRAPIGALNSITSANYQTAHSGPLAITLTAFPSQPVVQIRLTLSLLKARKVLRPGSAIEWLMREILMSTHQLKHWKIFSLQNASINRKIIEQTVK